MRFLSYSFYYQITSGGGDYFKNQKISRNLKCLDYGWSETNLHSYKKKYKNLSNLFINSGYNLRPLDVTAQ